MCLKSELFFQEVVEKNLRITQDTMKKRDDAESVDNDSTMSTSSNLEPFANDDLGIYKCIWGKFLFFKVPLGGIHLKRFSFCLELQIWYLLLLFFPLGLLVLVLVNQSVYTSGSISKQQDFLAM